MSHRLTTNKKKLLFWSVVLFYATTTNHFPIGLWHATKSGFYTTTGNDQLSGMTEKKLQSTSQSQICTKKRGSWSLFHDLLPLWSTIAFWIPTKPWHLRSMLSKSMRCTKDYNVCSQHWSTERAQFFSTTIPKLTAHNQRFQSWTNWSTKFCLIYHIHLTSPQLKHLDNFLQGNCFHNQQETENAFQEFVESWSADFLHYRSKQTYFSLANVYWLKCLLFWLIKTCLGLVIMI